MGIDLIMVNGPDDEDRINLGRAHYYELEYKIERLHVSFSRLAACGLNYNSARHAVEEMENLVEHAVAYGRKQVIDILKAEGIEFLRE